MQRSYDDLVMTLLNESYTSKAAVIIRVESFNELHDIADAIDKSMLFIVSAETQQLKGSDKCDVYAHPYNNYAYDEFHRLSDSGDELTSVDLSILTDHLGEYFTWFGEIDRMFVLGTSVVVIKMRHPFSVSHILRCCVHEIGIPLSHLVELSTVPSVSVDLVKVVSFTVNAFTSNSLSLNSILAMLKHVDPSSVVMVRRVNRLGFDGARVISNYFSKFGKVVRVFMLPLRSRKKSQVLPSKTGFVVMEKQSCCDAILASNEHMVGTTSVSVGTFVHKGLSYVNEY